MPTITISANSAMRTAPASTIGDTGRSRNLSVTASASGDSVRGCGVAPAPALSRSMTAAALDAFRAARVSISVMLNAKRTARAGCARVNFVP
jgi:hypothetical protein